MSAAALVVSDNKETAEKLETVIAFIEYEVALAGDLKTIKKILDQEKNYLIALIAVEDKALESEAIACIIDAIPSLPVYLVQDQDKTINQEPLRKGVNGAKLIAARVVDVFPDGPPPPPAPFSPSP